ncbi:MAG TPA: glycosyltransferase family 39 protein [Thermoanaerobaculia bacterium]|nr:glycosyltransferase family 39 protein [Thermoanaerobaculia bacterium]
MTDLARSRGLSIALFALLAWSLALRVWLGTPNPTSTRFYDERYGVTNAHALLVKGTIRPANGCHPGMSYLPQAALLAGSEALHRLTGAKVFAVFDEHRMTPTGYLICRFLQAVFGTLSIYLTYRIGRQVFSPGVGLLAAFLLAVVPWHLRQSVLFKPDIQLVAASLFAFDRSLAAAARPTWRRYLAAGVAIGIALASKFNAGPIAFPLMFAALSGGGWRDRRAWGRLVLAGAVSLAVFLLCTPFAVLDWSIYEKDLSRTMRDYEQKGQRLGGSHLYVLLHGLQSLFSWTFHGPVIAAVGLLGVVLLLVRAARMREGSAQERLGPVMMAIYVFGYALSYSMATLNPSKHNWLPLTPFTALAAAWLLFKLWEWLASRLPLLRRPAVVGAILTVLAFPLVSTVNGYTYRNVVPSTHELARRYLRTGMRLQGRTVIFERGDGNDGGEELPLGRSGAFVKGVGRLDELPPAQIELSDAVLFEAGRDGDFYRKVSASGGETLRFEPAPFRARGAELLLVVHPWHQVGEPVPLPAVPVDARRGRLEARLPDQVRPGEVLSLEIVLPTRWRLNNSLRQIQIHGQPVEWDNGGPLRGRRRIVSRRFQVADSAGPIVFVLRRPLPEGKEFEVQFRRWAR